MHRVDRASALVKACSKSPSTPRNRTKWGAALGRPEAPARCYQHGEQRGTLGPFIVPSPTPRIEATEGFLRRSQGCSSRSSSE